MSEWRNCNHSLRCPWCGGAERCTIHVSGEVFVCRTPDANEGFTPKGDGDPHWIHYFRELVDLDITKPIELTTELPPALDQPYLNVIYTSLLTHIQQNSTTLDLLLKRYGYTQAQGDVRKKELSEWFTNQLLYRPIPRADRNELAGYIAGLYDPEQIAKVPGFYKKDGKWHLNFPNAAGILIPVRNSLGGIEAIKIRLNDAKQNKYLSLSSSRFGGPKAKAGVHFPQGYEKYVSKKTIRIVEGEIKADIAMLFSSIPTISVPGVSSWAKAFPAIRELYRSNGYAPSEVRVAFDSDARSNPRVASSLECLCTEILEGSEQYNLGIETWPDEFKGIDDALVAKADIKTTYRDAAVDMLQQIIRTAGLEKDEEILEGILYRINTSPDLEYINSNKNISIIAKLDAADALRFYSAAKKVPGFDEPRYKAAVKEAKEGKIKKREDKASIQAKELDRPAIEVLDRPTDLISEDAVQSLYKINDPPRIFRFGAEVARTKYNGLELEILDEDKLSAELNRSALWVTTTGKNRTIVDCPNKVSKYIIQSPEIWNGIPNINSFIYWSCVTPQMKILKDAGFHKEVEAILKPKWSVEIPDVPEKPSLQEIQNAKDEFANLFYDFPFESDASRAVAYALVFTQVFSLIIKDKPFFVIEGSMPGSGKGKLVDCCTVPFNCERVTRRPYAGTREEVRKSLYGILSSLPSYVMFDNVSRCIDSETLAAVLTTNKYSDRELGRSRNPEFPVNCIWIGTGNNISASEEIARRMVRCTLQPTTEYPHLRTGWRIENIDAHLQKEGWKYQYAALMLTRAWINSGCPRATLTFGSYQEWAEIIGGILEFIGITGFLSDMRNIIAELGEEADDNTFAQAFIDHMSKIWGLDKPFTSGDVYNLCCSNMDINVCISGREEHDRRVSLGKLIRNAKGRIHDGIQLQLVPVMTSPRKYKLTRLKEEQ